MKRVCLILGFVTGIVLSSRPTAAQYTADFQTNIISGVTSNWLDDYCVGSNTFADALLIQNGGVLSNGNGYAGYEASGSNSAVLVAGTGSVWNNRANLYVGRQGAGNSLAISNGGQVANFDAYVGHETSSSGNNSLVVTGVGSVWSNSNDLYVGFSGAGNSLVIGDGGQVFDGRSYLGYNSSSSNNTIFVTGIGSVLSNRSGLVVGWSGAGNNLIISNGGKVFNWLGFGNFSSYVGAKSSSSNNSVVVSGTGSVWNNPFGFQIAVEGGGNTLMINDGGQVVGDGCLVGGRSGWGKNNVLVTGNGSVWSNNSSLLVGYNDSSNSLVISNGGCVVDLQFGIVGRYAGSSNNSARVTDGGVWQNKVLCVGQEGSANALVIAGGSVLATNLTVGLASAACDNLVQLDSGSVVVTNATHDAVFEVRNGKLILNGGVLQVDRFVMTNACAQFVRTGGALIYGTAVLDPNSSAVGDGIPNWWKQKYGLDPLDPTVANADPDGDGMTNLDEYQAGTDPTNSASVFRIIEIRPDDDDMFLTWTAVGGKRYALQTTTGFSGGFSNNFIDLNPAIVASGTGETEVSVLHLGAATNAPTRYYRVRLVP